MAIRLLALDLDGTLLNSRGHLSDGNREAITAARSAGVKVAVVTGRRFRDARPMALELGADVPLISHNGALTKHARTLETVAVFPLPLSAARRALAIGRAVNADALVSDDPAGAGILVYDHLSGDNVALSRYIKWSLRVHGEEGARSIVEVASLEEYLDHDPVHLAFSGRCEAMSRLSEQLVGELGATAKVFRTMYLATDFGLIDVVNPQASKGTGVAAAAAELGIDREEIMAIGDNFNDLEMLRYAGTGVVMANADAALRELPELHETGTNDQDGVAAAITRFIPEAFQFEGDEE